MHLFVDNLTNVDFSYLCPERGLLGETWLANVEVTGPLDEQGMVCDFGIVKKRLRTWLDETLDHCLLVPEIHSGCRQQQSNQHIHIDFALHNGTSIQTSAPEQAITLINAPTISPESVANWCEEKLKYLLGEGIESIKIHFIPENIEGPYYHYSHGLKKHLGNCQRIAHGHRSKVLIWKNGEFDNNLTTQWASTFKDIYLGTREDINQETADTIGFTYRSQQGDFSLTLPKQQCYLMDTDTTVEFIALHLASELKKADATASFKVKAFEGIGKGAIARS